MRTENEKIRQYLLGNLAADEARELDLQIIAEASLEDELLSAEDDLMDDYLDGILSPPETELFRKNFLVSEERRTALEHLARLKKYARNSAAAQTDKELPASPGGWFGDLKSVFMLNLRPVKVVFALAILCAVIGVGWRALFYDPSQNDLARADAEFARLSRDDLSDLSRFGGIPNVSLVPGTFRDAADPVSADRRENRVLFRLALPFKSESALFNVRLIGERNEVFVLERIRSYENRNGRELRILLPASVVGQGNYRIEVSEEGVAASPLVYSFAIR